MATHSSIPSWTISQTEQPGGLQSMGLQSQTWLSDYHLHTFFFHAIPRGESSNTLVCISRPAPPARSLLCVSSPTSAASTQTGHQVMGDCAHQPISPILAWLYWTANPLYHVSFRWSLALPSTWNSFPLWDQFASRFADHGPTTHT